MKEKYGFKKGIAFFAAVTFVCASFIGVVNYGGLNRDNKVYAADDKKVIIMQIDNTKMSVNGQDEEINPDNGTTPVIVSGRTLMPIRVIIEAMGGNAEWNGELRETALYCNDTEIRPVIDSETAYVNNEAKLLILHLLL